MPIIVRPDGPIPARIMIVGEAPGADEERVGTPFVGASGQELNRMLHEVGISRSECFMTNVARERPLGNDISQFIATKKKDITPEHIQLRGKYVRRQIIDGIKMLEAEIAAVRPNIIIAVGNTSMWALTDKWGIIKWRGSMLKATIPGLDYQPKVIPTYHPAAILRMWAWRAIAVRDLRRAAAESRTREYQISKWNFIVRPSFEVAMSTIEMLIDKCNLDSSWIDFDLETRAGHITCAGLSWSLTDAICIPFVTKDNKEGYWSIEEESAIIHSLYKLLTHKNIKVRGQNLLYDSQYTYRHWHFVPRVIQDTMISHHVAFAGLRKSLDFQASMYCEYYVQWKPEKGDWKEGG